MFDADTASRATARSRLYAFLARAFAEPDSTSLAELRAMLPAVATALAVLDVPHGRASFAEVCAELECMSAGELAAAHRRVFGHLVSGDCPPYEGEYGNVHIFQKTQCLADHAGFLEAFGMAPAPGFADRLDHIAVELEFLHVLTAKEAYAIAHSHGEERLGIVCGAERKYLQDHVGRWVPAFAARLEVKAGEGLYAALARLLAAFVAEETHALGVTPTSASAPSLGPQPDEAPAGCESCLKGFDPSPALGGEP